MPFTALDRAAVARALSQIAEKPDDLVDAYFERLEEVTLPPDGEAPGLRVAIEEGFAVRLARGGRTWLSSRDGIDSGRFAEALRQVARVLPSAAYPEPRLDVEPPAEAPAAPEIQELPSKLSRAIRERHVAFPLRLTVRRHRRWVQVVGLGPIAESESESFYSVAADTSWGRWGTLTPTLDRDAVEAMAEALTAGFRARHAEPPAPFEGTVVLAAPAAAVLLHEAVAHALEADVLAQGGNPEAAVGVEMASPLVSVLDDPAAAPEGVRRTTDDEGVAVERRWLLRDGRVSQPLADALWARGSNVLTAGAGRRGDRHAPPDPRSTHLELLPGDTAEADLAADADGGLWLSEARRGRLDPWTGIFRLELPFGRRIRAGQPAEPVGPCVLVGTVADLLSRVTAVADERRAGGAGWCAKGGRKLPVWATTPAIRLDGVSILPGVARGESE